MGLSGCVQGLRCLEQEMVALGGLCATTLVNKQLRLPRPAAAVTAGDCDSLLLLADHNEPVYFSAKTLVSN